jgi:YhcH/YjgK/YiaL family protein
MIVDSIENLREYFAGEAFALIEAYLVSLDSGAADGRTDIRGNDIFAVVSTYETRPVQECRFEAHRRYADIQLLLSGAEEIGWAPLEGPAPTVPHDEQKDVGFFEPPAGGYTRVALMPGIAAVFFPRDAHMPQITPAGAGGSEGAAKVRKVVIKVAAELLELRG